MVIIEITYAGNLAFVEVGNVVVGGEPVIEFVESETGYFACDAYAVAHDRWIVHCERHYAQ